MIIFKAVGEMQELLEQKKASGSRIGFVPTMGALHHGHISLIELSKAAGLLTVCSIFVNPTQFNDKSDLEKYPISTEADIELLLNAGCDVLFLPDVAEIYPGGESTVAIYDFGYLETILEGAHRPGHFKGVGQVVGRLLDIVKPNTLFLGQKDYQQCMVITKLKGILGLDSLEIAIGATVREPDGLAMSSRNRRLTDPQRALSGLLYQCLVSIQAKKDGGDFAVVKKECEDLLSAKGFETDYIALADATDLTLLTNYDGSRKMVALIAAKVGAIRLIDNLLL